MPHEITTTAKFPGTCKACGFRFPAGEWIKFDLASKTAIHHKCPEISYDGTEQAALFETWVQRAQDADKRVDGKDE